MNMKFSRNCLWQEFSDIQEALEILKFVQGIRNSKSFHIFFISQFLDETDEIDFQIQIGKLIMTFHTWISWRKIIEIWMNANAEWYFFLGQEY